MHSAPAAGNERVDCHFAQWGCRRLPMQVTQAAISGWMAASATQWRYTTLETSGIAQWRTTQSNKQNVNYWLSLFCRASRKRPLMISSKTEWYYRDCIKNGCCLYMGWQSTSKQLITTFDREVCELKGQIRLFKSDQYRIRTVFFMRSGVCCFCVSALSNVKFGVQN